MILVIDVGNTNIKNGLFVDDTMKHSWRINNDNNKTADEYGISYESFFAYLGHSTSVVKGIIISSVVPSILYTMEHMCRLYFPVKPIFVEPGIKTGISIKYDDPKELGGDRICNAVAAYKLYNGACITVDFGTATTFGAINSAGEFVGGVICPGLKIAHDALVSNAAKLFSVELIKPEKVIARSTVKCMQSGLIYGYTGLVDSLIEKMLEEMGEECSLVATGGMAELIVNESKYLKSVDSTLTLRGLNILYQLNTTQD